MLISYVSVPVYDRSSGQLIGYKRCDIGCFCYPSNPNSLSLSLSNMILPTNENSEMEVDEVPQTCNVSTLDVLAPNVLAPNVLA